MRFLERFMLNQRVIDNLAYRVEEIRKALTAARLERDSTIHIYEPDEIDMMYIDFMQTEIDGLEAQLTRALSTLKHARDYKLTGNS